MASEAGVLNIPPSEVKSKGRLRPGRMFLVDTSEGRIIADEEIKESLAERHPYRQWLDDHQPDPAADVARKNRPAPTATWTSH